MDINEIVRITEKEMEDDLFQLDCGLSDSDSECDNEDSDSDSDSFDEGMKNKCNKK